MAEEDDEDEDCCACVVEAAVVADVRGGLLSAVGGSIRDSVVGVVVLVGVVVVGVVVAEAGEMVPPTEVDVAGRAAVA